MKLWEEIVWAEPKHFIFFFLQIITILAPAIIMMVPVKKLQDFYQAILSL